MTTSSYLTRLPRTLFDSLATRSRGPHGMIDAPPGHVREEIAKAALTSGIAARGPVLDSAGGFTPAVDVMAPEERHRVDELAARRRARNTAGHGGAA
jgi:hypothetical protein